MNAFGHPVTIHPTQFGRDSVRCAVQILIGFRDAADGPWGRFELLADRREPGDSLGRPAERCRCLVSGEVCYEGILEHSREELQRRLFWACMLSGAMGHTYGANGIWQGEPERQALRPLAARQRLGRYPPGTTPRNFPAQSISGSPRRFWSAIPGIDSNHTRSGSKPPSRKTTTGPTPPAFRGKSA